MKKFLNILKQPYPYYYSTKRTLKNIAWIFVIVVLFLFLFSPFGINKAEDKYSYIVTCLLHGFVAAAIYGIFILLFNKSTNAATREEYWKVYKAILLVAGALFFVGLGNFFLRPFIYNNPDNFSWRYFTEEVINTFLLGTLIFGVFTLLDFYRLLKANQSNAAVMEQYIDEHKTVTKQDPGVLREPIIKLMVENETYELDSREFLFAKADGNYVSFYLYKNSSVIKELKRTSLKNIEEQTGAGVLGLIRTHRAYFVNTKHIIKVAGNAQGYQLSFSNIDFTVPVSRTMIPAFKAVMSSM